MADTGTDLWNPGISFGMTPADTFPPPGHSNQMDSAILASSASAAAV